MPDEVLNREEILSGYTRGVIINRLAHARQVSKDWHKGIEKRRRMYLLDHYSKAPKNNETQYPDPTPTNVVDVTVGILTGNDVEWEAVGFEPDANEADSTSNVEKFLSGAIAVASEREQYHVPYEVVLHAARDGTFAVRSIWDPIMHARFQGTMQVPDPTNLETGTQSVRVFSELPLKTEVVDPLELFVIPGGPNRFATVFRVVQMSVFDAETRYGFEHNVYGRFNTTRKMQQMNDFVDFWQIDDSGAIINAVLYDNKFIPGFEPRVMQGYTDLPYTIGFFKPVSRNPSKSGQWGHSAVDVLEPSVKQLEHSINRRARQIDTYSGLPMVVKALPGREVDIDPGFGHSLTISTEEEIAFPLWPGNPPDVKEHINFLRSRVQQSGFSDVMFGGANQVSGYALSQLSDQNRIRLTQPIRHLELFWSTWAKKVLRLTRSFASSAYLRVYGRQRGKDFAAQVVGGDIADYLVRARVLPEYPNEDVRKSAMATQAKGTLSDHTIMQKYYGIEQPDDEKKRKLIEAAENHPAMQLYGVIGVLQGMAEDDPAAEMALRLLEQQAGGAPTGGGTLGGSRPSQPLGLQSSTGQPTRQAQGGSPPGQTYEDLVNQLVAAAPGMGGGIQ